MRRMFPFLALSLLTAALLFACGDNDAPTAPEPPAPPPAPSVVGKWRYDSNNFEDRIRQNLQAILVEQGLTMQEAQALANTTLDVAEEGYPYITEANADGTYKGRDPGDTGTWRTEGNVLVLTDSDGDEIRATFTVTETTLTLTFTREQFLGELDLQPDEKALFDRIMAGVEDLVFSFTRVS